MLRDEYFGRLVDAAHIEVYLSANDGARIHWPWRMQPPKYASKTYRNACERYIIDSDPLDESVTTTDVLDSAYGVNAEVASLADVYQDKDATVDSLLKGLETYDDHVFEGELLLPLQAPYDECWREIGEPTEHMLGIGGLKDGLVSERIEAAETLRQEAGENVWIHGFGWGVNGGLAKRIREKPKLLDSTDYSTPMQAVQYDYSNGDESMTVAAMRAGAKLVEDLREVSPYVDSDPQTQRSEGQIGFENYV